MGTNEVDGLATLETSKTLIDDKQNGTALLAMQMLGRGLRDIRQARQVGKNVTPATFPKLLGHHAMGMLLYAQGMELLLKLIVGVEGVTLGKMKQHDLLPYYEAIKAIQPLKGNVDKVLSEKAITDILSIAEDNFYASRYFGLKRHEEIQNIGPFGGENLVRVLVQTYRPDILGTFVDCLGGSD